MNFSEMLTGWLKGNPEAIRFILAVHDVVELWDDLIDQDKEATPENINRVFYRALIEIPRNRFYQAHFDTLSPLIESAIFDWHTANDFEKRKEHLETAFGLRCTLQSLTVMSARIIAGVEWAQSVNNEIRSLGETWAEYAYGFGEK